MLLTIDHIPIAKKRHRTARGFTYDPQSNDKNKTKLHFSSQMRDRGYFKARDEALSCEMTLFMPKPVSWSQKRSKEAEGKPVINKPDIDNLAKFYLDVLNGIAYNDDKLISSLLCQKFYSDNPRVLINIQPIGGDMIHEHAITLNSEISIEELNYLVKKANKLGKMNREISRVYSQEDNEGKHIYFEVESPKTKEILNQCNIDS